MGVQEKTCRRCGQTKPISGFHRRAGTRDGLNAACKQCRGCRSPEQVAEDHRAALERRKCSNAVAARTRYRTDWAGSRLAQAKAVAKRKGLPFGLNRQYLLANLPSSCPVLGLPLDYSGTGGRTDCTASLDRIDNTKGYVPGNVLVVSWRANRLKCDARPKELRQIAVFYEGLEA